MRRTLNLIPVVIALIACAKTETPPADTAAAMAPEPAAMAPVAVTETDVAGTWTGTSKAEGSDSVVSKWTQVCAAGKCKGTNEGSKAVVNSTYTLAGDSAVGTTTPYSNPMMAKGAKIVDTWVSHINGENVTGTGAMKLASKPDSVVMRYSFTGSRQR
ncbi:MAG: hypothetical protein ABIW94_08170 [Gemmatimonadaceae bacterium]